MVVMFQQLLSKWFLHAFFCPVRSSLSLSPPPPYPPLVLLSIHLVHGRLSFHFHTGVDAGEVERLRSRSKELEETIGSLEEKIKVLQTELRHLDDEAAQLHKLRVYWINN